MTAREEGFLLLTGYLGDPEQRPLTVAQFRELTVRARQMERPVQDRELTEQDLLALGCDRAVARRIEQLLSRKDQLLWYLEKGRRQDCVPITRVSPAYPVSVRKRLGLAAPGVLWSKGDVTLLQKPAIALVGSRELREDNRAFAREVGKQAALQGYVLVSGDARGADRQAQDSCLEHGGSVICVVPDALAKRPLQRNVLYLSEDSYDQPFTAQRALRRNQVIHSLGEKTFVAQCTLGRGGTWEGSRQNLRFGYSPLFCFDDNSAAVRELMHMGAQPVGTDALKVLSLLQFGQLNFIDQ